MDGASIAAIVIAIVFIIIVIIIVYFIFRNSPGDPTVDKLTAPVVVKSVTPRIIPRVNSVTNNEVRSNNPPDAVIPTANINNPDINNLPPVITPVVSNQPNYLMFIGPPDVECLNNLGYSNPPYVEVIEKRTCMAEQLLTKEEVLERQLAAPQLQPVVSDCQSDDDLAPKAIIIDDSEPFTSLDSPLPNIVDRISAESRENNNEQDRNIIDLCYHQGSKITLLMDGSTQITSVNNNQAKKIRQYNSLRMERLESFAGQLYGVYRGRLYSRTKYRDNIWHWQECTWSIADIVHSSVTGDGKHLWLQSEENGYLYNQKLQVEKVDTISKSLTLQSKQIYYRTYGENSAIYIDIDRDRRIGKSYTLKYPGSHRREIVMKPHSKCYHAFYFKRGNTFKVIDQFDHIIGVRDINGEVSIIHHRQD